MGNPTPHCQEVSPREAVAWPGVKLPILLAACLQITVLLLCGCRTTPLADDNKPVPPRPVNTLSYVEPDGITLIKEPHPMEALTNACCLTAILAFSPKARRVQVDNPEVLLREIRVLLVMQDGKRKTRMESSSIHDPTVLRNQIYDGGTFSRAGALRAYWYQAVLLQTLNAVTPSLKEGPEEDSGQFQLVYDTNTVRVVSEVIVTTTGETERRFLSR